MSNELGSELRRLREQRGRSIGELARRAGYRNLAKGSNRIVAFERKGKGPWEILSRIADALDADRQTLNRCMEHDQQQALEAWNRWADKPISPYMVVRWLCAVYAYEALPDDITPQEAERLACARAKQVNKRVCLVLTRRRTAWISEQGEVSFWTDGKPGELNEPGMWMSGKPNRRFLLSTGSDQ